jgi:hypothetical protein
MSGCSGRVSLERAGQQLWVLMLLTIYSYIIYTLTILFLPSDGKKLDQIIRLKYTTKNTYLLLHQDYI